MKFETEFIELPLDKLHYEAAAMKAEGWRFIQTHAVNGDDGIDLYYSFMKGGMARNYRVSGVAKDVPVPSITDLFLAAFVFENEARELFGVDMRDIALDFQGALYAPAENEPMTFITPEQKAAREKARKAAAAAAKGDGASDGAPAAGKHSGGGFVMTPERRARLDAKLATMSPDKVAKVEAALKAREREASQAASTAADMRPAPYAQEAAAPAEAKPTVEGAGRVDHVLEEKLAQLDPEKAAKVRAALAGKGVAKPAVDAGDAPAEPTVPADAELEAKLAMMAPEKAAKVRAALGKALSAASKGGE